MRRLLSVLLGLCVLTISVTSHAGPSIVNTRHTLYAEGVSAFQAGDYARARDAFLRARAAGYTAPRLAYSLGATYYRLGQYALARQEFTILLHDPALAALSHYNLGLIADKLHEPQTARREFQMAYDETDESALKTMAAGELKRLEPPRAQHSRWYGYANLATGYDDNVALAPETGLVAASGRGSPLLTVLAGGGRQLTGAYADGVQLFGNYYQADYTHLSNYDQTMLDIGAEYRHPLGGGGFSGALSVGRLTFGGASFEQLTTLRFAINRNLSGSNRLSAGYQYQHVAAAASYDYLSGWQQQVFAEDQLTLSAFSAVIGYQHEFNSRNDLTTATEFFSNSPDRDRVYGKLKFRHTDQLEFTLEGVFEKSRYRDPDILTGTAGVTTIRRDDTLHILGVAADYRLNGTWQLEAAYRYLNSSSNIGFYSYRSNRITLSLQYLIY